jgi:hypothetical protein
MLKKLDEVYQTTVFEKDEHKTSQEYKKLSPKMRKAVEKTIREVSKKFGVNEKELMGYFEKEMLAT